MLMGTFNGLHLVIQCNALPQQFLTLPLIIRNSLPAVEFLAHVQDSACVTNIRHQPCAYISHYGALKYFCQAYLFLVTKWGGKCTILGPELWITVTKMWFVTSATWWLPIIRMWGSCSHKMLLVCNVSRQPAHCPFILMVSLQRMYANRVGFE